MTYYKHVAVIGRLPSDFIDTIFFFENTTERQARDAFSKKIYAMRYSNEAMALRAQELNAVSHHASHQGAYIKSVLTSESPISVVPQQEVLDYHGRN